MYLTFAEYQSMGGKLTEQDFNRAEFSARSKIDSMSFNRLRLDNPVRGFTKMLVFELITQFYGRMLDGIEIASEGAGRASVSYNNSVSTQSKIENTIRFVLCHEYKLGTSIPLLYAGNV